MILLTVFFFSALPPKSEEDVISNGVPGKKIVAKVEDDKEVKKKSKNTDENYDDELQYIEQTVRKRSDVNNFDESAENIANEQQKSFKPSNVSKSQSSKLNSSRENSSRRGKNSNLPSTAFTNNKDDLYIR